MTLDKRGPHVTALAESLLKVNLFCMRICVYRVQNDMALQLAGTPVLTVRDGNDAGQEGALRLSAIGDSDDVAAGIGVLEIFHAGAWGTVCDSSRVGRFIPSTAVTQVCLQRSIVLL